MAWCDWGLRSNFVDFVYAVSKFHEKQRKQESTDISRFGVFVGILLGNNKSSYPTHINNPLSNSTSFNRPIIFKIVIDSILVIS